MTKAGQRIPNHLGLILDGNRRWAKDHGLPPFEGHRRGHENLKTIAEAAFEHGVQVVSAYVFSTENWKRSADEVKYLMDLLRWVVVHEVKEMHKKGIRLVWLGSRVQLDPKLIKQIENAEKLTQTNTHGTLALCLNHGGHREIAEAVQRMAANGEDMTRVDESLLGSYLDHPEIPPLDLIVRTSGEQRLSNFMLWRAAYSELIFWPEHWPGFSVDMLGECLLEYSERQRRFGG